MTAPLRRGRSRGRALLVPIGAMAILLPAASPGVASAAGSGVQVDATGNGTRTLSVTDASGNALTPSSTLDATGGAVPFTVQVVDNGYKSAGFQVSAMMSNLYGYAGGSWTCAAEIPSSAVTIVSTPNSSVLSGLSAAATPVFSVTGTLTGSLLTLLQGLLGSLGAGTVNASPSGTIDGLLPSSGGGLLSQTQLVGATSPILNGALPGLPVKLAGGPGGATSFAQPAAPPSGSGCTDTSGSSATSVPILNGSANAAGVQGVLQGILGATPLSLSTLESGGYLDPTAVLSWLSSPGVLLTDGLSTTLLTTLLGANLTTLLATLTATLTSVTGLSQSGTYSGTPQLAVSTSSAPNGTYRGELTLTLLDTP